MRPLQCRSSLGAKESDIILPDTLEVEVEGWMKCSAEDSQNGNLVEAANKAQRKIQRRKRNLADFRHNLETGTKSRGPPGVSRRHSEKTISKNLTKTASQSRLRRRPGQATLRRIRNIMVVYVYTPILPENLGKFEVADTADLPEIDVDGRGRGRNAAGRTHRMI